MRTTSIAFLWFSSTLGFVNPRCYQHASVSCFATTLDDAKTARTDGLLEVMSTSTLAREWANTFGFGDHERAFYALFEGIRKEIPLGLKGKPFVLRETQIKEALGVSFQRFFTVMDLEKALQEEFLWAGRGTTDNRKAWEVRCHRSLHYHQVLCSLSFVLTKVSHTHTDVHTCKSKRGNL